MRDLASFGSVAERCEYLSPVGHSPLHPTQVREGRIRAVGAKEAVNLSKSEGWVVLDVRPPEEVAKVRLGPCLCCFTPCALPPSHTTHTIHPCADSRRLLSHRGAPRPHPAGLPRRLREGANLRPR